MLKKIYYSFYLWIEAFFGASDSKKHPKKDALTDNDTSSTSSIETSNEKTPVQSFSVKVLNWDENTVKTEWFISRDEGKYQVRYFPIEVFENKEDLLNHGQFLKAFLYISSGSMTIEFVDGTGLVPESDFPDDYMLTDLDSKLFKFK